MPLFLVKNDFQRADEKGPESLPLKIDFIPIFPGLEYHFDHEHEYDIFDIITERAGKHYSIHGEVTSPFDYFLNLFGLENALRYLVEAPLQSKEILQHFTEGVKTIAEEQIKHKVDAKQKINLGKPGGGFILSTACSIAPYTKKENIQILARVAEEVGRY